MWPKSFRNVHTLGLIFFLGCGLFYAAGVAEDLPPAIPSELAESVKGVPTDIDSPGLPERKGEFVGPDGCVKCHEAEYKLWSHTNHATNAYDLLRTSSNAEQYAENLGLDSEEVTNNSRCLKCHSTPQSKSEEDTGVFLGVTCEACHNAAGGDHGWLNTHMTYGPNTTRREHETAEHRVQRIARCKTAGQNRSEDLYLLAKRCYECHVIGDEELVVKGGHHPGNAGFEMTIWFNTKIRHNLFLNPHHNNLAPSLWIDPLWRSDNQPGEAIDHTRQMYIVALLVDLELSLRNRAKAKHASFALVASTRIASATSRLKRIVEGESLADLENVLSEIAKVEPLLFIPPAENDGQRFLDSAQVVSGVAKKISSEDQGNRFSSIDELLGIAPDRERLPEP